MSRFFKKTESSFSLSYKILFAGIIAAVLFSVLVLLLTNGGILFRDDEAKAACYTLLTQKYPDAEVLDYMVENSSFREVHVTGQVRALRPNRILDPVELRYDCVVNFRTGYPQARLQELVELP
jgi:hypothetical protein